MRWLPQLRRSAWLLAALLVSTTVFGLGCLLRWSLPEFVGIFMAQMALYGVAAWQLLTGRLAVSSERRALIAILLVAAVLRGIALFAPQALSTDAFRYVWDGRVQAAGVNPYRYIPADPALRELRDASIYPNINRAHYAATIYPPAAQLAFLAIERISDSITGMKLGMLAFDGLSIACLIALLRRRGMPATRVLLYAWHPLPIWEFAGSGHVDAMAIALLLLALLCAERRAPLWTGIVLAAATLVKFYPLVGVPAMYRRWDWRMPVAFLMTFALLYAPYLGVGSAVFGFMPGYAQEEGLRSGSGIFLWSLLQTVFRLPDNGLIYALPVAALCLLGTACWLQFRRFAASVDGVAGTFLLASVFTVLVSPHNAWYFAWLIPWLCFRFSLAHVWLTGACTLIYVFPYPLGPYSQAVLYLPFLSLLALQFRARREFLSPEKFDANRPQSSTVL